MKSLTVFTLAVLVALTAGCPGKDEPVPAPVDEGAKPVVNPLDDALAAAGGSGKNLLVEYYDVTCDTCRDMDQKVFSAAPVTEALGDLVYVRVTKGKDAAGFEKRFGRPPTPSFVILSPEGEQHGKLISGSLDEGNFLKLLNWAVTGEGAQPSLKTGSS